MAERDRNNKTLKLPSNTVVQGVEEMSICRVITIDNVAVGVEALQCSQRVETGEEGTAVGREQYQESMSIQRPLHAGEGE